MNALMKSLKNVQERENELISFCFGDILKHNNQFPPCSSDIATLLMSHSWLFAKVWSLMFERIWPSQQMIRWFTERGAKINPETFLSISFSNLSKYEEDEVLSI
jgi:hypothetical protein